MGFDQPYEGTRFWCGISFYHPRVCFSKFFGLTQLLLSIMIPNNPSDLKKKSKKLHAVNPKLSAIRYKSSRRMCLTLTWQKQRILA